MKAVKQFPGLYDRNGRYIYRAVIPLMLRTVVGKTEFKRSLGTDSLREAKRLWAEAEAEFVRIRQDAERQLGASSNQALHMQRELRLNDVEPIVREWHAFRLSEEFDILASLSRLERKDQTRVDAIRAEYEGYAEIAHWRWRETAQSVIEHLCNKYAFGLPQPGALVWNAFADRIIEARVDLSRRILARIDDDFSKNPLGTDPSLTDPIEPALTVNPGSIGQQHAAVNRMALGDEIDRFVDDPARGVGPATRKANRSRLRVLREHFGSDRDLKTISSHEMEVFRDLLLQLPRDPFRSLPGRALADMPALASELGLQLVERKSVRLTFETISSFFKRFEERGLIERNPCKGLAIKKDRREVKRRRPFRVEELKVLFGAAPYVFADGDQRPAKFDGAYWIPLIALFSGMRLGEICQLWTDDVVEGPGGVAILRVRENVQRRQTLKTGDSERDVPIHRELERLGFVEWARSQRGKEPGRLFPEVPYSNSGSVSDVFSKRFAHRMHRLKLGSKSLVFHSFRHSFVDAMRNASIEEATQKAIGGWAARDVHSQYGQGPSMARLKAAMDMVWYDDDSGSLDLRALVPF